MKKMILGLMIMSSMSAFATDFTMTTDRPSTIDVHGCSQGEVGYPQLKNSITGSILLPPNAYPLPAPIPMKRDGLSLLQGNGQ